MKTLLRLLAVLALSTLSAGTSLTSGALAVFTDGSGVGASSFAAGALQPPSSVTATSGTSIILSWNTAPSLNGAGYHILRSATSGGPYSQVGLVTPATANSFTDSPSAGTYYYVVRSYFQNWDSSNTTQVSAAVTANTGYRSCTAYAAVTTGSGDNNGYQVNPANACANDGAFAEDTNSGTSTTLSCTDTGKDRHLFYDNAFTIPAGSTINGMEIRLDAFVNNAAASPSMCVELSWNGGSSWTAAKSTTTLTNTETTYILGTPADTWGRSWAVGDFTNANFRLRITDVASNNNRDFRLDWVAVKVTYTLP